MLVCGALAGICLLAFVGVMSVEAEDPGPQTREIQKKPTAQIAKPPAQIMAITKLTYEGLVVDTANTPMEGVTVKAQGKATYTATTDAKGVFKFTNMTPGEYQIIVQKQHHVTIKVPMYNKFTLIESPK
jgi:protocatechuate 3,4-dioxygenase beta subunit